MRPVALALVAALAALAPAAPAHEGGDEPNPANHSPGVLFFTWQPFEPKRGEAVTAYLTPAANVTPSEVVLRVCRVQAYSCRAPVAMDGQAFPGNITLYTAAVPWDAAFFRGVTRVGLAALLRFANGSQEETPVDHWPARPADLPADGGVYYYYSLPAESRGAPGPALGAALAAAVAGLVVARRRP